MDINTKKCFKCLRILSIDEFTSNSRLYSGLQTYCKRCRYVMTALDNKKIKQEMINAYGGKCECCAETTFEFLTLEHKNGDGVTSRVNNNKGAGVNYYRMLKKLNWPKDNYTVLCMNCNHARRYGAVCPHNKEEFEKYISEKLKFVR